MDAITDTISAPVKTIQKEPQYADVLNELKHQSMGGKEFPLTLPLAPMHTGLQPQPITRKRGTISEEHPQSPNAIRERAQKSLKESEKRLKAIEDHMWQHRQQERDLKRAEKDIVRQEKHMQRSLKQYQNKLFKRQENETNTLLDKEATFTQFWQQDLHMKEEATKDKIHTSHANQQKLNEDTKKFMKSVNEMSWRYKNLMELLERKRTEMEKLSQEFETHVRAKEEEQHKVKEELASLAITMNMEAQKRRHQEVDTQRQKNRSTIKEITDTRTRSDAMKHEEDVKQRAGARHEEQQRKLDQTTQSKQNNVRAKQRQEGRHLADVRTQLQQTSDMQHYMQQEAEYLQLSIRNDEINERVDQANAKWRKQLDSFQQHVKDRNKQEFHNWSNRALGLENEAKKREHEDRLKTLSKTISHQDSIEHSLYSRARDAESLRKKQVQIVEKLQNDLDILKRNNARKLKEAAVAAQKTEQELQQKIVRESAELSKAVNTREESLRSLTVQRRRAREDRRMLDEEKKEHTRRVKIASRTQLKNSMMI